MSMFWLKKIGLWLLELVTGELFKSLWRKLRPTPTPEERPEVKLKYTPSGVKEVIIKGEPATGIFINDGVKKFLLMPIPAPSSAPELVEIKRLVEAGEIEKSREKVQEVLSQPMPATVPREEQAFLTTLRLLDEGDSKFHSEDLAGAEKAYDKAYQEARQSGNELLQAICLNLIGATTGMQGKEALPHFEESLKLNPDSAEAWGNRGNALSEQGRYKEAVASYDRAIRLNPDFASAWYNRGISLEKKGRNEEAIASYDKAIELKPSFAEAWNNKGAILCDELGRTEQALSCFDKALESNPNLVQAWCSKGAALGNLSMYDDAISCFNKALSLKSDDAEGWNNRGIVLGKQGKYEEAVASYDKAIRLNPDFARVWHNRGNALSEQGRYKEAVASYDKAVELDPNFANAWYNRGIDLGKQGRYEEAIASFDKAIELNPDFAEAWYSKGIDLGKQGRYEEAIAFYDKAIELNPDFAEAWNNKGAILCDELGQIEEATFCFDKALDLEPTLIEPWLSRGVALSKLGRVEEAKRNFQEAFSLREKMPDKRVTALDHLTRLILGQGLESITSRNMKETERRALELAQLRKEAEKDDMAQVVNKAVLEFKGGLSKKELKSFDEFKEILRRFKGKKP